ncbi:peptidoglycan/LPS O-acetylase OafA/YrhL [Microvirga flocculans]|uniref:Peptidoglycan/LPS O-acetylase OafA/YrhL n=1 Tax=Microvirga flocculans TaxID=217168 RepID=A0A7W6II16_9HYPH|nr:acyltransferase [Microvirga flocculans]MBB4041501.1 peptidoglycan/LPS O-acetylase OafA/YrhL [Microvirga flocculans]
MATIAEALEEKSNNFDLLRLGAALLVLFSHSYPLSGTNFEPIYYYLGGYDTGGGWAVSAFFIISGFLVTQSLMRRSLSSYIAARVLRVFPALAVVILLQTFALGPLLTKLPLEDYFNSPRTYAHLQKISVFFGSSYLPGVFSENPLRSVNGSLWTLSIEVFFYGVLPCLALMGLLGRSVIVMIVALIVFYAIAVENYGLGWNNQGGKIFPSVPMYSALKQGIFFLSGAALWIFRDRIKINVVIFMMSIFILFVIRNNQNKQYFLFFALPYIVIYLALVRPIHLPGHGKVGDISYGVYIYAFPVQQLIIASLGRDIGPIILTAIATPITLIFAVFSWIYIEKPALSLREKILGQGASRAASQTLN